jgi:hypothetical protein
VDSAPQLHQQKLPYLSKKLLSPPQWPLFKSCTKKRDWGSRCGSAVRSKKIKRNHTIQGSFPSRPGNLFKKRVIVKTDLITSKAQSLPFRPGEHSGKVLSTNAVLKYLLAMYEILIYPMLQNTRNLKLMVLTQSKN